MLLGMFQRKDDSKKYKKKKRKNSTNNKTENRVLVHIHNEMIL